MIADNENIEPVEEPEEEVEPQLTPENMRALLCILVGMIPGITIPQKTFDEFPKDAKINITFDEVNQLWRIWVPRPQKRGLVVPKRRIITPN